MVNWAAVERADTASTQFTSEGYDRFFADCRRTIACASPEEFAKFLRQQVEAFAVLAREAGFKMN